MPKPYPKVRLFVEPDSHPPLNDQVTLTLEAEQTHYLSRVMRMKEGEAVAVFNGRDGEWRATIHTLQKKTAQLTCEEMLRAPLAPVAVTVCFAPLKFGRIDYLVQKMTELGACALQPVITDYAQSDKINPKRLRANMIEAAEQCERVEVPVLHEPVGLRTLLADWPPERLLVMADETGAGEPIGALCASDAPKHGWGILIGPEGGFSPDEHALLASLPFVARVGLGPRILRADTAALSLLSITQSAWGDWEIPPHFQRHHIEGAAHA